MRKRSGHKLGGIVSLLFILPQLVSAQTNLTLKNILEKNIQAAGGKDRILQIRNFSFKSGGTRYVAAPNGELKMMTGKEPVITEVILVKGDKVLRNAYNSTSELTGIQKSIPRTLAKLCSGLFTLLKFGNELAFQGLKSYGPEKFFQLTSKIDSFTVDFFLRSDDFTLRRLVFQGANPAGDKIAINYDFAPFEKAEGLNIPLSWFSSQVGTRGTLSEITEFKLNQPLDNDFFDKLEVNIGSTEAAPGRLKGNVLDFDASPLGLILTTNWTKTEIAKAGLSTNDKLSFIMNGLEAELVFYASPGETPSRDALARGARILAPLPRGGETYVVQLFAVDTAPLAAALKILAPIEIKKK